MPDVPLIRCTGLGKSFGELTVLDEFDLDIAAGEHVCFIGPSGSGKSTFLRLLMTLARPDRGRIAIDGELLWPETPGPLDRAARQRQARLKRRIGMVFQHFNLFPHLDARGNVALALRLVAGASKAEARQRAEALLERVGLVEHARAMPAQLSGGQKQRVAIARALALEPAIMLFDEATSALDPELVGEVLAVIEDLASSSDMTMLFVTHQLSFVERIGHRVVMLDGGRIVEDGVPAQVFADPQHPRTQAFLSALPR